MGVGSFWDASAGGFPEAPRPEIHSSVGASLGRRFGRVRTDGKRLSDASPAAEYHALRIRTKRLRYSLEVFGELYGKPAERVASALKQLQDTLGDYQDAEAGIARLHAIVSDRGRDLPPETLVIVGRLIERRSEEHTSELQSLMRISSAVF